MNKTNLDSNNMETIRTTVGVAALGNPHCEEFTPKNVGADSISAQREKGITLVSLVITIVIMLILAGVAISIAVSPDGLFGQAENATTKWNDRIAEEEKEMDKVLGYLGIDPPIEITDQMPEGKDWDNSQTGPIDKVLIQRERMAPIPKGFTVSQVPGENSIKSGMVIYKIPEGAEVDWNNSKIKLTPTSEEQILQNEVDQYVWIPVDDINQMIMCKDNNKTGTVTVANTTDVCNIDYEGDVLKCKIHDSDDLCGRLYGTDTDTSTTPYKTNMKFSDRAQKWESSGYREPDVVSSDDDTNTGGTSQITDDFITMAKSVKKYGGFYVGRYEAGIGGASKKGQIVITAANSDVEGIRKGLNDWYGLYKEIRKDIIDNEENGTIVLKSHMIYGSQYDQIINFIGLDAQVGHAGKTVTSQSATGKNETDKLNNIYDIEGNNCEWTVQAYGARDRVRRGRNFGNSKDGKFYPASHLLANYPTSTSSSFTTRAVLTVVM